MKKIFTLCLMILTVVWAHAQIFYTPNDPDTLFLYFKGGGTSQFLSSEVKKIDFSDPNNITIYKQDGSSKTVLRKSLQDIRFRNRYSNPYKLLTSDHFGGYETMFLVTRYCSGSHYFYACLASDEMFGGGSFSDNFKNIDFLTDPTYYNEFKSAFDSSYKSIEQINNLLTHVDNVPSYIDKKVQNHVKGELLFLRAHHHYELASMYGPIQVITDNNSWEQKLKTFTPEMTWGQILLDLKNAIELMDGSMCPSLREDGRVSRYAAEAMLARSFLFYTGFYQGKHDIASQEASVKLPDGSTLTKQNVIDYLADCIANSPFYLVNDYRNLWPYTNSLTVEDNPETAGQGLKWVEDYGAINPEVLFKIRYNNKARWDDPFEGGYSNKYSLYFGHNTNYFCLNLEALFPIGEGWGAGTVAPNLWDDWAEAEPTDMRRNASIQEIRDIASMVSYKATEYLQLTQYHEKKISPIVAKLFGNNYYYPFEIRMFCNGYSPLDNQIQGGNIHPLNLIRYSDVLLMYSELTGTVKGINLVRARAGLSPISTYSLKALQQERRWELAFEGVRWNDMRRWGDEYCKTALDKQLYQPIIMQGERCTNTPEALGFKSYSEKYAENHGFMGRPDGNGECAAINASLSGNWYLGSLNGITYGTLKYEGTTATNFVNNQTGLIKGYSLDEMKEQVKDADGEISKYAYMCIEGNTIAKFSSRGYTIAEGKITINETNNYDWRICHADVTNKAVLGSSSCSQFDILSLNDSTLVLVETTSKGKDAQFWVYKKGGDIQLSMQALANKKWSYAVGRYIDFNTREIKYSGTWGDGGFTYDGEGLNIPLIYCRMYDGASPYQLVNYADSWGLKEKRDADPYAYMIFDLYDETISKYTRDGKLIAKGKFECDTPEKETTDILITVHNEASLFPYSFYGEGETVEQFYLRYALNGELAGMNYETLTLQELVGKNSGFTYWLFGQRGIAPEEMDDQVVIKQFDKNNNPSVTGCYFKVSLKNCPNRILNYECTDGTKIFTYDGYSRVDAEKGGIVTKELRVWTVNCNNDTVSTTRNLTFLMRTKPSAEIVIYNNPEGLFVSSWDASYLRFSDNDGKGLPYLTDDVYWGQIGNDLHFVIKDAAEGTVARVMNGWWTATYYDNLPIVPGEDFHFTLTEQIAKDCARGNGGRDLDILLTKGHATITKVYYTEER